jgi:hypothetical protein
VFFPIVSPADRERANHDGLSREDVSLLAHPIRYLKWRRDVRKLGPYAPAFNDGRSPRMAPVIALVLCLVALGAAVAIILLTSSN